MSQLTKQSYDGSTPLDKGNWSLKNSQLRADYLKNNRANKLNTKQLVERTFKSSLFFNPNKLSIYLK
jgi:hypothetical protein